MSGKNSKAPDLFVTPKAYLGEVIDHALHTRGMTTSDRTVAYLIELLEFFLHTDNLFEKDNEESLGQATLAELYLRASQDPLKKRVLLKKLGDSTLYISGFFGDSLKRKVVDIDYYAEIGGRAYGTLAAVTPSDRWAEVFAEFSERILEYIDLLTYISQKALVQTNKDLLRLYDRYLTTGSELAKDQLLEQGLLNAQTVKGGRKQ